MPRYVQFILFGAFPLVVAQGALNEWGPVAGLVLAYCFGGVVAWSVIRSEE